MINLCHVTGGDLWHLYLINQHHYLLQSWRVFLSPSSPTNHTTNALQTRSSLLTSPHSPITRMKASFHGYLDNRGVPIVTSSQAPDFRSQERHSATVVPNLAVRCQLDRSRRKQSINGDRKWVFIGCRDVPFILLILTRPKTKDQRPKTNNQRPRPRHTTWPNLCGVARSGSVEMWEKEAGKKDSSLFHLVSRINSYFSHWPMTPKRSPTVTVTSKSFCICFQDGLNRRYCGDVFNHRI